MHYIVGKGWRTGQVARPPAGSQVCSSSCYIQSICSHKKHTFLKYKKRQLLDFSNLITALSESIKKSEKKAFSTKKGKSYCLKVHPLRLLKTLRTVINFQRKFAYLRLFRNLQQLETLEYVGTSIDATKD